MSGPKYQGGAELAVVVGLLASLAVLVLGAVLAVALAWWTR